MRARVNRVLVEDLLDDPALSYREIARRANCSDFSVRTIARDYLARDDVTTEAEPLSPRDWFIVAGIGVLFFAGIWLLGRRLPPPNGEAM